MCAADIEAKIALVTRIEIDATFEEFEAVAGNTKFEALLKLKELHAAALVAEEAAAEALRTKARLEQLERENHERIAREMLAKAEADAKEAAEREVERKAAAARQRQSATANELVDEIRRVQRRAFSASSTGMLELVGLVEAIVIGHELGDFAGVAQKAKDDALTDLHAMHAEVVKREADKRMADAELAAQRAESERLEALAEANRKALAALIPAVEAAPVASPELTAAFTAIESLPTSKVTWPSDGVDIDAVHRAEPEYRRAIASVEEVDAMEDQLTACRMSLAEALELLEGWIHSKAPKKQFIEQMAKVAELRTRGGLAEVSA
jgi:hypothetical protein